MFEPQSFEYALDAGTGVATITLNRPERLNALTFEVYDELRRAFYALSDEDDVRVVIITGTGRGFCTGGDVEDIIGRLFERDMRGLLEFTRMTCDLILAMRRCRKPVIGALNGRPEGAIPIVGAWLAAFDVFMGEPWDDLAPIAMGFAGVAQAAGLIFMAVGLAIPDRYVVYDAPVGSPSPYQVSVGTGPGDAGLSLRVEAL